MCSTLRKGHTQWLWATFCIAYTFQLRVLIRLAAKQLVVDDVLEDAASTPLASAFAIMRAASAVGGVTGTAEPGVATGTAAEEPSPGSAAEAEAGIAAAPAAGAASAPAGEAAGEAAAKATGEAAAEARAAAGAAGMDTSPCELIELLRQGVAQACYVTVSSAPEVLVVVVIMRMDQLAGGRPGAKEGGKYLSMDFEIVSGSKRRHLADSRDGSVGSSSSKADRGEWPEVSDELLLSLLQQVKWGSLQEAELIALHNQAAAYIHVTPAANYVKSRLLECMAAVLLLPTEPAERAEHIACWVDFPPAGLSDVSERSYQLADLRLVTRTVSSSKAGFHMELDDDDGKLQGIEWSCVTCCLVAPM